MLPWGECHSDIPTKRQTQITEVQAVANANTTCLVYTITKRIFIDELVVKSVSMLPDYSDPFCWRTELYVKDHLVAGENVEGRQREELELWWLSNATCSGRRASEWKSGSCRLTCGEQSCERLRAAGL